MGKPLKISLKSKLKVKHTMSFLKKFINEFIMKHVFCEFILNYAKPSDHNSNTKVQNCTEYVQYVQYVQLLVAKNCDRLSGFHYTKCILESERERIRHTCIRGRVEAFAAQLATREAHRAYNLGSRRP